MLNFSRAPAAVAIEFCFETCVMTYKALEWLENGWCRCCWHRWWPQHFQNFHSSSMHLLFLHIHTIRKLNNNNRMMTQPVKIDCSCQITEEKSFFKKRKIQIHFGFCTVYTFLQLIIFQKENYSKSRATEINT